MKLLSYHSLHPSRIKGGLVNKRVSWTQSSPATQQIDIMARMENVLACLENGKLDQAAAVIQLRDGICQLAELQPFLEKGCWDNGSLKLLVQSDDQILNLIFDHGTPPDRINDLLFKIKNQLDKRRTRRINRIRIEETLSSTSVDATCVSDETNTSDETSTVDETNTSDETSVADETNASDETSVADETNKAIESCTDEKCSDNQDVSTNLPN